MYKGNMELVKQEFIADVLAGMTSYTKRFADTIMSYWNNTETIDSFKVSEYTHSTDAGGKKSSESSEANGYGQSDRGEKLGYLENNCIFCMFLHL